MSRYYSKKETRRARRNQGTPQGVYAVFPKDMQGISVHDLQAEIEARMQQEREQEQNQESQKEAA